MSHFTLVTGGSRSGKSSFAELLASNSSLPNRSVTYIATAQIWDEEMAYRVKKHQQQRPSSWRLIEEPLNIKEALLKLKDEKTVILLDCVTLWLTNLLLDEEARLKETAGNTSPATYEQIEPKILALVQEVSQLAAEINPPVIFVTNEVGQGIVPENPLSRAYRDLAGRSNQVLAKHATKVYLVLAGLPIEIKEIGQNLLSSLARSE